MADTVGSRVRSAGSGSVQSAARSGSRRNDLGPRGGLTVVLLHGTTASLGVWDPVVERLGASVRTIAIDQRGHGSDKPATGYGAAEYVADVLALVRVRECGPVVLVGHSLGARNAVVLGAAHPDVVAGVVAVDYTPFVEPEVLDALEARVRGGDRGFASAAEVEAYLRDRYPLLPDDAVHRRRRYGYIAAGDGLQPLADPGVPDGTVELALIVHDPDAPLPHGFTHWVVYGIDPADAAVHPPDSGFAYREEPNSLGTQAYTGPQPPPGHGTHRYCFWVYALDTAVTGEPTREEFLSAYGDHVIEQNRLVGTYSA
ncbi:YbhB/YbcL family Raf kinase inhibitor-like protein [Streptomyces scopuliridis]